MDNPCYPRTQSDGVSWFESVCRDHILTFEQAILKLVFKSMTNPIKLRNILTNNQKKKLRILQNVQTDYLYLSFMKGQSIKHN